MTITQAEAIAAGLTLNMREIMIGNLIDIPPEEADELEAAGLKLPAYFHEEGDGRRMIWPITPLGLEVRAILLKEPTV